MKIMYLENRKKVVNCQSEQRGRRADSRDAPNNKQIAIAFQFRMIGRGLNSPANRLMGGEARKPYIHEQGNAMKDMLF
jgi:hypothetical protein